MKTKKIISLAKLGILTLGVFLSSCSNEDFDENIEGTSVETKKVFFMGDEIVVEVLPDETYQLGDMTIFPEQVSDSVDDWKINPEPNEQIKLGLAGGIRKWSNNTVVYVIDNSLSQFVRDEIQKSMNVWTSKTNIRFKERTNESSYVTFTTNGQSCNCGDSTLGDVGSRSRIRLGSRTSAVVTIHEIGHTLGYVHEQTRADRDNHVIINFQNIQDGAASQFRKNERAQLIGDFDLASTMMYGSFTFSKNGQPTITDLNGNTYARRRADLSAGDIAGTNQIYPEDTTNPDPDPDPNPDDICDGVDEWVRGQRYQVGDQVTYRGFLFERDFTRWNNLGQCGTAPPADICEGIAPYNGNNSSYSAGDKVTFRGSLYERQSNGRWTNEGQCGSN